MNSMLNNLESDIVSISEGDLDRLFDVPGNPSAEDLTGGKEKELPVKSIKEEEVVKIQPTDSFTSDIEEVTDLEEVLGEENKVEKKEKAGEEKEEIIDEKEEEGSEDKDGDPISSVLKNTMDFLIEKGEWADFEGREDLEMDQKVYAELAIKQNQHKVSAMFSEMIDKTGPYGKAIIGFIKQGGDPDEVIDLFKEQKSIENLDTDSEEGKRLLITKYYKDVTGWKPEKIERHIRSLIANDELDTETSDVKDLFNEHNKQRLNEINAQQRAEAAKQQEREERFRDNITSAIYERKDLTDKDKKLIERSVLQYSNKLSDGTPVSDFYVKFSQIQSDPKEYIELVRYVMDKESFMKNIKADIKNKVTDDQFNFVKGNTALSKTKGSTYDKVDRKSKSVVEFDWNIGKK